MLREVLNLQNYYWNLWSVPLFIVGLLVFLEGFFVYIKGKNRLINRIFFLWLLSAVLWLIGFGLVQVSKDSRVALYWYKHVTLLGVIFISFGSYLFSLTWLMKDFSQKKNLIIILFLVLSGFYLSSFWGNLFVKEMRKHFWGYYPFFGMVGHCFLVIWISLFIRTLANLFLAYRQSEGVRKKQLFYIYIAVPIAYIGAIDFVPIVLGIELYPFGYIPVFIAITSWAYAIIRYKAMEVDTVIHRTILWVLTSSLILVPLGILLYFVRPWLIRLSWIQLTFVTTVLFYVYFYYYLKMQPRIDHLFRRRKYDYQTILGKVAEKIATTINIEDLSRNLLTEVCEAMYLRNSLLYILSKDESKYSLIGRRGYKEIGGVRQRTELEIYTAEERINLPASLRELNCDSLLCKWLIEHQDILEKEQVEVDPQYESIKQEVLIWFKGKEVELIVPLVLENKVNAFLGLGKKENLQHYTVKDVELLRKLGQEAGVTIFNALHYEDLAEKERLDEEMRLGRDIQMNLLPRQIPQIPGLNVQGLMQPAKEIGGDYYDFITLPKKEQFAIVIGDVSGKGVGAGLIMSMTKATVYAFSQEETSPKQILLRTNYVLYHHISGQKFMTLLYLLWQSKTKTITYSSAGHEHILIYRDKSQTLESIQSGGFMLGMIPDIETFLEEKQIELESRDKILLYTDGVTEAQNPAGDRFTLERLKDSLKKHGSRTARELIQAIKDEVYAFIGNYPQYDDITLVVLETE